MSGYAIAKHAGKDKLSAIRLAYAGGCPIAYDILSEQSLLDTSPPGDSANLSYLYALGFHWLLYLVPVGAPNFDVRVLKTDGAGSDTIYTLASSVLVTSKGKLVSDGESVWAAVVLERDADNPYQIDYTDDCAGGAFNSRNEHDAATWNVEGVEVWNSTGGSFTYLGREEAKFNNTGGGDFTGGLTGMTGGVDGCAADGTAYFTWSECGYTGDRLRRKSAHGGSNSGAGHPACCATPCGLGGCNCQLDDILRLSDDACCATISATPADVLPTFPGSTFPGPADTYPDPVGDWSWFGMRWIVTTWDNAAQTGLLEPADYCWMKSVDTVSYGDEYFDDSQIFNPSSIVFTGAQQAGALGDPLVFTIFPTATNHTAGTISTPGTEVTVVGLSDGSVLQTLTAGDAVPTAGRTIANLAFGASNEGALSVSRVPWTDPIDNADIYYVGTYWVQDDASKVINVNRFLVNGDAPFDAFDLDPALVARSRTSTVAGTIMPETWNVWEMAGSAGQRYERHCPRGWITDSLNPNTASTAELALVDDAIYYAILGLDPGVEKACICRLCEPCPGETLPIMASSIVDGAEYEQDQAPVDWWVRACAQGIVEVVFTVDDVVVTDAVTPVGLTFYYGDTPPGTFDVGSLSVGDHDLCWTGFDACGAEIATDCATITVNSAATGMTWKIDGVEIINLPMGAGHVGLKALHMESNFGGPNDHFIGDVSVGTTGYGSTDLFFEDWSTADFSNWDSVSDPTSLFSFVGGRLKVFGDGDAGHSQALKYFPVGDSNGNNTVAYPIYIRMEIQINQDEIDNDSGYYYDTEGKLFNFIGDIYVYLGNLGFETDTDFWDCDITCPTYTPVDGVVFTLDIGIFGP